MVTPNTKPSLSIHTPRLILEPLALCHDDLILSIFNDPDFLQFVGDKQIRTLEQARQYLRQGPMAEQAKSGIINYAVFDAARHQPIGMCGLLKRPYLPAPDLGYGFLPSARGQGLALEAATAVLNSLATPNRLWAMVHPNNLASVTLLTKLGFAPYSDDDIAVPHSPVQLMHRSGM